MDSSKPRRNLSAYNYLVVLLAGFVVLGKYFLIFVLWQAAKRTMYGFYVEGLECLAFTGGGFHASPPRVFLDGTFLSRTTCPNLATHQFSIRHPLKLRILLPSDIL